GLGVAADFIIATIVLTIFSIGFVALARHITAAGAFYTFISHGIGKPIGLGAGMLSLMTYATMEAALIGIFSALSNNTIATTFGVDVPWIVFAVVALAVISILSYADIELAAKVLAVILIGEIAILSILA